MFSFSLLALLVNKQDRSFFLFVGPCWMPTRACSCRLSPVQPLAPSSSPRLQKDVQSVLQNLSFDSATPSPTQKHSVAPFGYQIKCRFLALGFASNKALPAWLPPAPSCMCRVPREACGNALGSLPLNWLLSSSCHSWVLAQVKESRKPRSPSSTLTSLDLSLLWVHFCFFKL